MWINTNANELQVYGTWTSSNPEVISIDPYGTAWAVAPGTANIHFTTLSGATLNEWVMTVGAGSHAVASFSQGVGFRGKVVATRNSTSHGRL